MGLLSFGRHKEDAADEDSAFASSAAQDTASTRPKARKKARAAEPIDPVLPEKQRARRRLVGAVALVLAAVIGLPMILDPEPKPLASDISIDIPSKEKAKPAPGAAPASVPAAAALDQREEIVDAAPAKADTKPDNAKPATAGAATAAGAAAAAAAAAATTAAVGKVESGKTQEAPQSKADAKPESRPAEHKAEHKAELKPENKVDQKDAARKTDDTRAKAILDGRETAADKAHATTDKSETYLVQVAALASPDKVRELQNKLKAAGLKSSTQKVATQSGERIRVRVGPVQGRAEAEKMRARLNKMGLNGTLVPA